jgi:hypothetical protein
MEGLGRPDCVPRRNAADQPGPAQHSCHPDRRSGGGGQASLRILIRGCLKKTRDRQGRAAGFIIADRLANLCRREMIAGHSDRPQALFPPTTKARAGPPGLSTFPVEVPLFASWPIGARLSFSPYIRSDRMPCCDSSRHDFLHKG